MNYEEITSNFNDFEINLNECNKLTDVFLKHYKFTPEMNELLKTDFKIVRKIVDFHYMDFKLKMNKYSDIDDALNNINFIQNPTNKKKDKYISINNIVLKYLKSGEFFIDIFVKNEEITNNDIQEYKDNNKNVLTEFKPRINQQDAFDRMQKYGLETGIHCQATGCGKTAIILRYIEFAKTIKKIPELSKFSSKNPVFFPKVILFTERVSILADLFLLSKDKLVPDEANIKLWKSLGIADLTDYDIINRVTIKKKDWMDLLINANKPTLLIINRAYLTLDNKLYEKITDKSITLILHDECHNTSSEQCHKFLLNCKNHKIPIVGFSATPLRTGKGSVEKLLQIYSNDNIKETNKKNKLNLLTDYNMIYAISNNLILPPDFYWYQIEAYNKIKKEDKNTEIVTQEELGSVLELLNHIVLTIPNKKIIAWCGTIKLAEKWKELFEQSYKQRKNLVNFKFGIDTSKKEHNDYEYFKTIPKDDKNNVIKYEDLKPDDKRRMYYGNSILFCANKHREGSDIKLLDACIFLDKVKDRSPIPFIQSIGRVLRICPDTPNKLSGIIIDGFVKENNSYEKEFVNKIFDYYLSFRNLTDITDEDKTNYEKYIEMRK